MGSRWELGWLAATLRRALAVIDVRAKWGSLTVTHHMVNTYHRLSTSRSNALCSI